MNSVIVLENISFFYAPERPVFHDLSFALQSQEKVGIIGQNGAGKTTLFHLMVGLLTPQQGRIELFGKTCHTEKDFQAERPKIGLLFQDADDQLFCPTVAEDIAFGPLNLNYTHEQTQHIVHQTLTLLNILPLKDRITHQLSGGEKRLVALATIMAMHPQCFLFDEPTTGLSDTMQKRLIDILNEHIQTCVIISHDQAFLKQTVQKIYTLQDGQLHAV